MLDVPVRSRQEETVTQNQRAGFHSVCCYPEGHWDGDYVCGLKDSVVHSSCRWDPGVLHPGELQGQIWLRTRPLQGWLHFLLLLHGAAMSGANELEAKSTNYGSNLIWPQPLLVSLGKRG